MVPSQIGMEPGATIYIDPLLHALGVPNDFNVLDSHTVLSGLLAGASGIMAYTSISVLTRESMDYFGHAPGWGFAKQNSGAMTAVLFLVGACFNILLVHAVSRIMPQDSPIKHACSSHPPSPLASSEEESDEHHHEHHANNNHHGQDTCTNNSRGSSSVHVYIDESGETQPLLNHPAGGESETSLQSVHGCSAISKHRGDHHVCTLSPSTEAPCSAQQSNHVCRCEYACTKQGCYNVEHCHITPLYPHLHAHPQSQSHSEHNARCAIISACPVHSSCAEPQQHRTATGGPLGHHDATAINNTAVVQHNHHNRSEVEPEVQLSGPGDSSAAQISSRHQRLLIRVGLQTAVAIALHKIPEGLIIYMSRKASPKLGISVAASLFFHNLPEGIMLALPLFLATGRRNMAFLIASAMGAAPPAIGALLGMLVLGEIERDNERMLDGWFGVMFGVTSGMMCMVSLNGMLPTARIYDKSGNIVAWCFALGVAAMMFANSVLG
ncbi:Zinc transporter [Coemansia sp. RSA 2559]|nr:Zinc transporter [Coemansia sp. RSA 2559]